MKNLQERKALRKKVMEWSEERWLHHKKCQFRTSWNDRCNCNYELDK